MVKTMKCLFCGYDDNQFSEQNELYYFRCGCTAFGTKYSIDVDLYSDLSNRNSIELREYKFHFVSGYIREMLENGHRIELKNNDDIRSILKSPYIPNEIMMKVNKLINYIYLKTISLGSYVSINMMLDKSITYSIDSDEFNNIINFLIEQDILKNKKRIDSDDHIGFCLTVKGLQLGSELEYKKKKSNQCFIAMSFNTALLEDFKKFVFSKVRETGFEPITVDIVPHNDNIADRIIYEIKNSHFVVADFTEQKQGVYFEAGYALGLGLQVIWTVKDEDISKCHFDTNHYNHIVWKTPDELGRLLRDRILATISGAKLDIK